MERDHSFPPRLCTCDVVVTCQPPNLNTWVRFLIGVPNMKINYIPMSLIKKILKELDKEQDTKDLFIVTSRKKFNLLTDMKKKHKHKIMDTKQ